MADPLPPPLTVKLLYLHQYHTKECPWNEDYVVPEKVLLPPHLEDSRLFFKDFLWTLRHHLSKIVTVQSDEWSIIEEKFHRMLIKILPKNSMLNIIFSLRNEN